MTAISISNIAWEVKDDEAISSLLSVNGVKIIDIAPGKYFLNPKDTSDEDIKSVKVYWGKKGFRIYGMQSLLFGTTGLNMFGSSEVQKEMLVHLGHICRIANGLDARFLVFGSPKNRDRNLMSNQETQEIAVSFFQSLAKIASKYDVTICLEPNPSCYNCNFMIDSKETAEIVRLVNHPSIQMQLDTGSLMITGENPFEFLKDNHQIIKHVHISEPYLVPFSSESLHSIMASSIKEFFPDQILCIETLANGDQGEIVSSINLVNKIYKKGNI